MTAHLTVEESSKHFTNKHKALKKLIDNPALLLTELETKRAQNTGSIKFRRSLL